MKTQRNILIAFLLNLSFSIFEFIGGIFTGSVAILSDSVHDMGDALSIGLSYFLEKKSKHQPDGKYTYGYARFSVLGSFITTAVLLLSSSAVLIASVKRLFNPVEINYDGMIIFAIIGAVVNFICAYFTSHGESLNQRAVNLHMLEDVAGWLVVLVGAIVMKFTDISYIDPIMSALVAVFIIINAVKVLKEVLGLFLVKTPQNLSVEKVRDCVLEVEEVEDVHHIHLWSSDGSAMYSTMHIVCDGDYADIKHRVKDKLMHMGIAHITLEIESQKEVCSERECKVSRVEKHHHHQHHH